MTASAPDLAICSAKGCRRPAETAIVWRNPSLHHGGRVKQWVACPDHLEHLSSFLARRDFLLRTEPLLSEPLPSEPLLAEPLRTAPLMSEPAPPAPGPIIK